MSNNIRQLPKWFRWVSNPFLAMLVWPTLIWILYAISVKKLYPLTYSNYLSNFWWYPVSFAIPLLLFGGLVLKLSDNLNMNLRRKDANGILRPIGLEEHYKKHEQFKSPLQKVVSVFIFIGCLVAPYMAGWAFFGGIVWFFAKNAK